MHCNPKSYEEGKYKNLYTFLGFIHKIASVGCGKLEEGLNCKHHDLYSSMYVSKENLDLLISKADANDNEDEANIVCF